MERKLQRITIRIYHYDNNGEYVSGKHTRLRGNVSWLRGNVSGLKGNVSGLTGDVSGLKGDVSGLRGDASGLKGDVSGLRGDVSWLRGDVNICNITDKERAAGIDIEQLVKSGDALAKNKTGGGDK